MRARCLGFWLSLCTPSNLLSWPGKIVKTKIDDLRTRAGEYYNENDVGETVFYYNTRVIIIIIITIEVPTRRLW